jgi:hypothetical protein
MAWFEANACQIVLVVPMIGILFVVLFRQAGALASCSRSIREEHRLSGWDGDGNPLCIEPDGTVRNRAGAIVARSKGSKMQVRVYGEWERGGE